jgi:hypothetical protein
MDNQRAALHAVDLLDVLERVAAPRAGDIGLQHPKARRQRRVQDDRGNLDSRCKIHRGGRA